MVAGNLGFTELNRSLDPTVTSLNALTDPGAYRAGPRSPGVAAQPCPTSATTAAQVGEEMLVPPSTFHLPPTKTTSPWVGSAVADTSGT